MTDLPITVAHNQKITHHYEIHFPAHEPRQGDPLYVDFNAYRKAHIADAQCYIGQRVGFQQCSLDQPLELHHAHIEFSLQNGVSLTALAKDYPGIDNPTQVGQWIESEQNFRWLCVYHHRGLGGAHNLSHSDFEASQYIPNLT
jgi:hypothetical protein